MKPRMKKLLGVFLVLGSMMAAVVAMAAGGVGVYFSQTFSSTNLTNSYASGGVMYTTLSGKSELTCTSTATTKIIISTTTTATNCSGGTNNLFIPAAPSGGTASASWSNVYLNSHICMKSGGSTISAGEITCVAK